MNSLAFTASSLGSLTKIPSVWPTLFLLNVSQLLRKLSFILSFVVTVAGFLPFEGPKIAPYIVHSAVYALVICNHGPPPPEGGAGV